MKDLFPILLFISLLFHSCGSQGKNYSLFLSKLEDEIHRGDFSEVYRLGDSLIKNCSDEVIIREADSLVQIANRMSLDFSLSGKDIENQLSEKKIDFNTDSLTKWESFGWLEYKLINGEKRYFKSAVSNLGLIKMFYKNQVVRDSIIAKDERIIFRRNHTQNIIGKSTESPDPAVPVEMEILYTITVKPNAVPPGETVRCWLPFPKENHPRQTDVYLLAVSNEDFILAPDSVTHRTLYMENIAEKDLPVVFSIAFSYRSYGQYFNPGNIKTQPYNRSTAFYKKYTSEKLPQICFTEKVRKLTDSIVGSEDNPFEIVKKIYMWFNKNIPWAAALEYSIMPDIPEYVIDNRRGDCGMQTFLFMSMLRYKGIPVRWQSGWMVPPGAENLHDWCEVWFEGTGWAPLDISYNLQYSVNPKTREFYLSGIDSYRMIINDGISGKLFPEKEFIRSEPYDFQRGEVEWSGGNLYFDKWDYDIKITYK